MKKIFIILMLTLSFSAMALFGLGEDKKDASKEKTAEECEIPTFAKVIGHEDKWLLHNGCPPRENTKKVEKHTSE
ncbi:hypothetical protein BHECKSOX2_1467 [Bathymodiolus heckerae thiotrophic gill symbiont]|uniref:hypothetical protein n=1 Tax=Bathymodiolus heckerae thiotrophic gill symbiont TaxID=1052212 RepID=UPI0010BC71A7|nr:hypothetical protein [Bathymodiolus heckerae thiotrophic gill symbiont]SMN12930.1 hypothetical protein BHECKSOX2_1467 [Bathymodiolus heckerae thiotrophic gill symbiont]SMN14440.1 hypothetical protein CRYPD_1176 [uncultured Candidatus Thioglobus sp.]